MAESTAKSGGPLGWIARAARGTVWAARKFGYYGLPPFVYDSIRFPFRMLVPRVFQPRENWRLREGWRQRYRPNDPPIYAPAEPEDGVLPFNPASVIEPFTPGAPPPPAIDPQATFAAYLYQNYHAMAEGTEKEIKNKLERCHFVSGNVRIDRVRQFREIARLEQLLGNDVKAALYKIRGMRLGGGDHYGDLDWVLPALRNNGYGPEAEAVYAMYAKGIDNERAAADLVTEQRERLKQKPKLPDEYSIFDDRRGDLKPRVSVIVTVYNAAFKIPKFLGALQLQTLNRKKQMELVIVDSASPMDEYAALKETVLSFGIPTLFVRTKDRETIQTAWNRALGLVRGPYLSFLGADEAIAPETLETLADTLDAEPSVDWVQGSILLTEVDPEGNQSVDVMTYDKTGFVKDLVYLETCYLGPVGAMHRKSLHERFGYFDGSYRGAGDTEFKNRVLPDINVKTLPNLLGLYINYPEERTTQSPRAELEDARAWYLHRTTGAMKLAYAKRSVEEIEAQIVRCLWYRKSYSTKMSTDFALAWTMIEVLRERAPDSKVLALLGGGIRKGLGAIRAFDRVPNARADLWHTHAQHQRNVLYEVLLEHRASGMLGDPDYFAFNDNCYEQHQTTW